MKRTTMCDVDTGSNVGDVLQQGQQEQQQQQEQILNVQLPLSSSNDDVIPTSNIDNNISGKTTISTATTITPIYLRVKRRVNVIPATSIRLEGLVRQQQIQVQVQETDQNMETVAQTTNIAKDIFPNTTTTTITSTTTNNNNDSTTGTVQQQRPAVWKLVQSTSTSLLLKDEPNTIAATTGTSTGNTTTNSKKRIVTAILNDNDNVDDHDNNNNINNNSSNTKRKRRRLRLAIVNDTLTDACISSLLLFQHSVIENKDNNSTATTTTKTEQETMTITTTIPKSSSNNKILRTSKNRVPLKILHPLERLINDSLQQVFVNSNNRTPIQHYEYIMNEFSTIASSVASQYGLGSGVVSNTNTGGFNNNNSNNNNYSTLQWLLWCNEEHGNILHACAMWNDCTVASMLLEYCCNLYQSCIDNNNNNIDEVHFRTSSNKRRNRVHLQQQQQQQQLVSMLQRMIDTKNYNQQTPYDVAKVLDHTNICDLIINYQNTITAPIPPTSTTIDDDNNNNDTHQYEYDLYCLLPDLANTKPTTNAALPPDIAMNDNDYSYNIDNAMVHDNNNSSNAITVKEIKNDEYHSDSEDDDGILCELGHGHVGYWNENGELVLEMNNNNNSNNIDIDDDNCINSTDTDDDDDSNRESYVGNDYPDYNSDSDDNDDKYDEYYNNNNNEYEYDDHNNYYSNRNNDNNSDAGNSDYDHNDENDNDNDIDGLYDPSYGIY